jgi:predicted transcriptional regulator
MSFWPQVAELLVRGEIPWEFRRRRSGCEPGTRVLIYASKEIRAVTGIYTVGEVFAYDSCEAMTARIASLGYDLNPDWLAESFEYVPEGHAFEVLDPLPLPSLALGYDADGKKVKGPQGFQYLDLGNQDHRRLWEGVQASARSSAVSPCREEESPWLP